jgi:hypothetical protein
MMLERVCSQCAYLTTRLVDRCPICDVPLRQQERAWERSRRAARLSLPPRVNGNLNGQVRVTVVDLSPLGVRLEHAKPLLPKHPCLLTFAVAEGAPLRLPGNIVWTRAYLFEPESGETKWLYHSGMEFHDLSQAAAEELGAYLHRVTGGLGSLSGTATYRQV